MQQQQQQQQLSVSHPASLLLAGSCRLRPPAAAYACAAADMPHCRNAARDLHQETCQSADQRQQPHQTQHMLRTLGKYQTRTRQ
jgi:hypothetical protein